MIEAPVENPAPGRYLGDLLIERGLVSADDRDRALSIQERIGGRIGAILVRMGAVSEDNLLHVLSDQLQMPLVQEDQMPTDLAAASEFMTSTGISREWWIDHETLLWELADGRIRCISRDPLSNSLGELIERHFSDRSLEWCLIRNHDLEVLLEAFTQLSPRTEHSGDEVAHLRELAEEAPVIEFVNNLISQAADQRASDIHIEPQERHFAVRFRIDGVLYNRFTLPRERFNAVSSRVKIISGMDIAERRLPQDGRIRSRVGGRDLDIRSSSVPGIHGESTVLRLLPAVNEQLSFDSLGFSSDQVDVMKNWVTQPNGIILVTGPTGSGKSTTLHSVLESINDGRKKIITVEDPVEYQIPGITQIQAHEEIGYSFASAFRSILRQDPDVVMIGEIRDTETAEIAIQASLTGHLVLSTLHTNDATSAFTRLLDMGIEPFLIATPVRASMAQRLVRRLCPSCATPFEPPEAILQEFENSTPPSQRSGTARWLKAAEQGCKSCHGTGYTGRAGIFEMVTVTPELQRLIIQNASQEEMWQVARSQGAFSLRADGLLKAFRGMTSVEEVLRVTAH